MRKTIEQAQDILEAMLSDETFIAKYGNITDYTLDSEEVRDSGRGEGESTDVWVEASVADHETIFDEINDNYNDFAQTFEEYATAHGLDDPEILHAANYIIFKVNV